jgi:cytochrome c6
LSNDDAQLPPIHLFDRRFSRRISRSKSSCIRSSVQNSSHLGLDGADCTAGILLTTTAALANEANLQNGAALFQANCAGCHAGGMNFMSEKKTLKKEALEQYQSLDQAQIQKFVQQGMPHKLLPFSKTLTDADYFDATSFVLDQALNDKW